MQVIVNGVRQDVPSNTTVSQLLTELQLLPERVVVEINLTVVDREQYSRFSLKEEDHVEIIGFVGGGI